MPILELPPNPRTTEGNTSKGDPANPGAAAPAPALPPKNRYAHLEQHELIHLLDALDDERARAQFRESVYISTIICLAIAWFLFYGPHIIFRQPYYKDPLAAIRAREKEQLTYIEPTAPPAPKVIPRVDKKVQQAIRQAEAARPTPPAPEPPKPQPPASQPEQQAMTTTPPVPQPQLPVPAAPKPAAPAVEAPLPAAPKPNIAANTQTPGDAIRQAARNALGRSGADYGSAPNLSPGPLHAGTQILSDIGDWDPSLYMRRLHADIQRNWNPLIPQEVEPPLMKKGIVGIRFTILRDGEIGSIKLETTSGDVALDKAAWYAITSEGQFPPLPNEYKGQQLDLRVGFFYNQPIE